MAMTRLKTITMADIQKVADQIAERFHPEKVILFGSHAYGTPAPDSDVDLMVVMDTDDPMHTAGLISAGIDHPFSMDILVYRPSDMAEYLQEGAIFATRVMTKGKILYEASYERVG
jgi:predicted nucleotidyltransferase